MQSRPSWLVLWFASLIEHSINMTRTQRSTSNISLTVQTKWDHNLPKKNGKTARRFFIGILIVKGQLHIRQFETLFQWHRLWCLGVCCRRSFPRGWFVWRKWMHFSYKDGRDLPFFDDLPCFASCNCSCNQRLWLLCAFEWKQVQPANKINHTPVIFYSSAHLQLVKAFSRISC